MGEACATSGSDVTACARACGPLPVNESAPSSGTGHKHHNVRGQWCSQIVGARPIEERPSDAEDRSVAGHLESDLILGGKTSQIATLVCRKTRHLTIVQLADRGPKPSPPSSSATPTCPPR